MIADSLILTECVYRPGSFAGLMTLYESSYLKLGQLVGGDLAGISDGISHCGQDCDLHLSIDARDRYTTTLRLTYWFEVQPEGESRETPVADPDLTLRLYHDARMLEAVSLASFHRHHKLQELAKHHLAELDRRWQRNMMLNKWLDYVIESGHSFT